MKRFSILTALLLLGLVPAAAAQNYALTARPLVQSPTALGMGDAGVAFPTKQTVFFYNPAHLARAASIKPSITLLGVRGSLSTNLFDQIAFYEDDLDPAIEEGFENLPEDEVRRIYDEALELGRRRTFVNADVLLPSVMMQVGGIGVGGGVFAHSRVLYRFPDGGAGVPLLDLVGLGDVIVMGSAAADLGRYGVPGVTAGLTAKYTRRYLTFKEKPIDLLDADENFYLLSGNSVGVDLGLLYEPDFVPLPGRLTAGLAVYDVAASDFSYGFDSVLNNDDEDAVQAEVDQEEARANEDFALHPSYRIGVAYTVPALLGLFKETGVALDYVGYSDPFIDQVFLAHISIGAQAKLARILSLRAGLNQGYPSVGAGLALGLLKVDYAFYGVEQGRLPGQVDSYNHTLQLVLSL